MVGRLVAAPADDRADAPNLKATCLIVGLSPYSLSSVTGMDDPPVRRDIYESVAHVVDAHGMDL